MTSKRPSTNINPKQYAKSFITNSMDYIYEPESAAPSSVSPR